METLLTKEQIEQDIKAYQDRLSMAEVKLSGLPGGLKGRKLAQTRRVLLSEIRRQNIDRLCSGGAGGGG